MSVKRLERSDEYCGCSPRWLATLCKLWRVIRGKRKGGDFCVYIPERIINRPDPLIYSQFMLMQLNQPVTWDNPDVAIFLGGVEQYTYDLTVSTEYDIAVTVRNSSREKPAMGTRVEIRWIEFGAGGQIRTPIDSIVTNVPVWPGTSIVNTKWKTPASPGHYCLEIELFHPDDGVLANNRGWNNTQVKQAHSQVRQKVKIFNRFLNGCPEIPTSKKAFNWFLWLFGWGFVGLATGLIPWAFKTGHHRPSTHTGGYVFFAILFALALGAILEWLRAGSKKGKGREQQRKDGCEWVRVTVDSYRFNDKVGKDADPDAMFAPRPPVWNARVEPDSFAFAPGEAYREVELIVDAPDFPGPDEAFNVTAWQGGEPSGGVTVTIHPGGGN